jgi:DNA sulfur modification protein DndB
MSSSEIEGETMSKQKNSAFPSLRAQMGDWWYYVTTMTLKDVAAWIKRADEIHEKKELKTWIQRDITPARTRLIADYLITHEQHFFNSIVVGIYGGDPDWYQVTLDEDNPVAEKIGMEHTVLPVGYLTLRGDEEIFAVDGQHRVEGIKEAIRLNPGLGEEQLSIIFIGHQTTDQGRERTRRLFSTLNKYAVPVSKGEIVALNEDDAYAIATRKLIDEYAPLSSEFVPLTKTPNIPANNKRCITTVVALYELTQIIATPKTGAGSREKSRLKKGPPQLERITQIYNSQREFWDALRRYVPAIKEVTSSDPDLELAQKYRNDEGGHVLFRPVGQKAFANAVRVLMDRRMSIKKAVETLSQAPLDLNSKPWNEVLWKPVAKKIINSNEKLAQNLFLYIVGQRPHATNYDVLGNYRKALGDENASLRGLKLAHV